ncbi:YadA-like family protein [Moraxella catarrhalis]|uniref:YadA-like family protein n=1 Tax=Moraxella catarrhalis TaxID=480 RepID=UPI00128B72D3|nr:YadA-like family protein [Moraxella catarrhalis]MPX39651.1 cell surface protein [Moraxella catarrhalis]MPX59704.1 cell surface protein [Moraxella catarrhalis]MPX80607.1 cell surface protein [Moraxella catarrhalis]
MNKIYKVKKNAAGHLVACSEFAKGHTKKAVLGSLLIVGILGMATTASAQRSLGNTNNNANRAGNAHIGGGSDNEANGKYSTIGGGYSNTIEAKGEYSTIGGGYINTAKGTRSTIGGGALNEANNMYSTVGGGEYNRATGKYSTIAGGGNNQATKENSTVGGGRLNQATGHSSTVAGGGNNQATNENSTVGGGRDNQAIGHNSTVTGGYKNEATGRDSTIAGGRNNQATNENSTVGGGRNNQATNENSTVGGGRLNQAIGRNSTVAGGYKNKAKGTGSFAAGVDNQANAENAVALGKNNIINGDNSVAIGSNNTVKQNQTNVFILGSNTDTKDAQSGSVLLGDKTTGKTATAVNDATVNGLTLKNFAGTSATNGVVSVGRAGGERQIVNVGAGEISATSTDAVNGSQLHALATAVDAEFRTLTQTQNALIEQGEAINQELEGLADYTNAQDEKILKNQTDITANKTAIEQNFNRTVTNGFEIEKNKAGIAKNQADIQTLENNVEEELLKLSGRLIDQKADIDNNINNIYELAQQQDQHSSDIKTLKNNVEEGLLDLSGRLIDQKADIAKNQADIAQNQTDIQDLAAYNELQDAYAKQQTEAIDALNKASSANTDRIATAELGIAENKKDAQIAKAQANENKDGIAKNQADIQLHDKKITNLGILHSMVARAVGNNTQGVATNKADIAKNQADIAKNQADIANNIKNIYELAQQQDQHSSDIKTLAKVSAANTDRIAKNKAEADASFETLTKNQNTLIEQGEALVEQNKAINQELEGFAAHADVQDKQILQNQADITTNKAAIEQNINRTVANGFEIEKNKAGIATNKQELILQNDRLNRINETNNHQDQKIDQLGYALKEQGQHFNNRISAVERQTAGGIANAIAIATLPSPSRAGEHHVLFGSGYHNGQAAVSLGAAGLSGTGKSTYKIGLSWSDAGGLSGGVGGSYRWK